MPTLRASVRAAAALLVLVLLTGCGDSTTSSPASTEQGAPTADAVCALASTPTPDLNLRANVVQQAQISSDAQLQALASQEHDPAHSGTATAVVDTDEGAPPVAKRYDAVYAFCQGR